MGGWVSSVAPQAVRRGKAGTHRPAQPRNARCPPICPRQSVAKETPLAHAHAILASPVSRRFQGRGDVSLTAEVGLGAALECACVLSGSRKSAMASIREATLQKLRRFSELRGTVAELSSLAPCTEGVFPRTPCSFLSSAPSCPLRPGQASQTFPSPPFTLWEPKHRCQEGAVRELLRESNTCLS